MVQRQRTVLVTGGSRGIGAAIAERFAREGCAVVIHYAQQHEAAEETAARCRAYGVPVLTAAADLRSRKQLLDMRGQLLSCGRMPDILVNNAGVAHYGLLSDMTEEEWDR